MDEPRNFMEGATAPPKEPAHRVCLQCGEDFLTECDAYQCGDDCREAYEVRLGLGFTPEITRLHVERWMDRGDFVLWQGKTYILIRIATRGPMDTVGEFVTIDSLPPESPLRPVRS